MGFRYRSLSLFSENFDQKQKSATKFYFLKDFQRRTNGIDILAGVDPVSVKFGPKGTDPNRNDARFTFHTPCAVQSAIADFLVNLSSTLY